MILCLVFPEQERRYGYCVANIKEKIKQMTTCPLTGKVDKQLRSELNQRYHHIMEQLKKLGYDHKVHSSFIEYLVNTYGIMKWKTSSGGEDKSSMSDPQYLRRMITEHMPSEEVENILILLSCLAYLCELTGSAMFLW
ncbi:speriolin-like protein [Eleutherodactylus coqui]|uniref:speriolin-like protein n=1 Tax=Eleutherodactylus coqui TaxID=57060 RepID=UPI0034623549